MIVRQKYLEQIKAFQDRDLIKVVTGVRRCGKSTLLDMMIEELKRQGVSEERLFKFKMESMEFDEIRDYRDLYQLVKGRIADIKHPYLFFDELQEVDGCICASNGKHDQSEDARARDFSFNQNQRCLSKIDCCARRAIPC